MTMLRRGKPRERRLSPATSVGNEPVLRGKETSVTLGEGSYGYVKEVTVGKEVYAGKFFHPALLESQNDGYGIMASKVCEEFQLMARLQHPNITKFVGPCYVNSHPHHVLLMEKLERSVDDLLENGPKISWALKLSILRDVSSGLFYLHANSIIHRDLTAKNVLLTLSMDAKITDFGNSRILDPAQERNVKLTEMPGAMLYMPPEAQSSSDSCVYDSSLDIFSFGQLALFTALQSFPRNLLAPTYKDLNDPEGRLRGRTEVERRAEYFTQLEKEMAESQIAFPVQLIKGCLDNDPSARPTVEQLEGEMQLAMIQDRDSEATLLLEKLLLGKLNNKLILIAGKCHSGKSLLKQSLTMFGGIDHSVNIAEFSPQKLSSTDLLKTPANLILFCTRVDLPVGEEDKEVIACLVKAYGSDFVKRTLFVLTMANQVHQFGTHRRHSEVTHLQMTKEESMTGVLSELRNQKLKFDLELLKQRFVLAGAPENSQMGRLIPNVESSNSSCKIDWIVPVARALLNFS